MRTLVEAKDLPKPYGGDLEWKYEDEPLLDDAARAVVGEMPKGPAIFADDQLVMPPFPNKLKPTPSQ